MSAPDDQSTGPSAPPGSRAGAPDGTGPGGQTGAGTARGYEWIETRPDDGPVQVCEVDAGPRCTDCATDGVEGYLGLVLMDDDKWPARVEWIAYALWPDGDTTCEDCTAEREEARRG